MTPLDPLGKMAPYTTIRRAYGPASPQFGDLYLPTTPGPYPVVILIHGGFWRAAYGLTLMSGLAENLVQSSIAVWNIEYRRIGDTGGGWPGTLHDAARAVDALSTFAPIYNLDLRRVVPIGHSAGGHLALWLAARRHIPPHSPAAPTGSPLTFTAVVSLAGVLNLEHAWYLGLGRSAVEELLGGGPEEVPDRYAAASPIALLPLGLPQLLLHGTADDRVPLIISQEYARKASAAGDPVKLIELPAADHFVLIDPDSAAWRTCLLELEHLHLTD